jgi:hypothetical protein
MEELGEEQELSGSGGDDDGDEMLEGDQDDDMKSRKEKLLHHLKNEIYCDFRRSLIHGVGIHALRGIPSGVDVFKTNCVPNGQAIDLTEREVNRLPEHVKRIIQNFVVPHTKKGRTYWPVPEAGLNARDCSWYVNSANFDASSPAVKKANLDFGLEFDQRGYTQMKTSRDVTEGEELLVEYGFSLDTHGGTRGQGTISGQKLVPLPGANTCRICQEEVSLCTGEGEEAVDLGCACIQSVCHYKCAQRWFVRRMKLVYTQNPDFADGRTEDIVNDWIPSCAIQCEVCFKHLRESFAKRLLNEVSEACGTAGESNVAKRMVDYMDGGDRVAVRVSKIPNQQTRTRIVGGTVQRSKGGGTERRGGHEESYMHQPRARGFRSMGRGIKHERDGGPTREVRDLTQTGSDWQRRESAKRSKHELEEIRSSAERPGAWAGKTGRAWMEQDKQWVPIKIHSYISAEDRNKKTLRQFKTALFSSQTGPKRHRGMYRFTYTKGGKSKGKGKGKAKARGSEIEDEDYFSDGDATVKLAG